MLLRVNQTQGMVRPFAGAIKKKTSHLNQLFNFLATQIWGGACFFSCISYKISLKFRNGTLLLFEQLSSRKIWRKGL